MSDSVEKEIKEVLQCAFDYLYINKKAVTVTIDGKKYIMGVAPAGQKVMIREDETDSEK